ncbi:MAG TPA: Do family serine endopeptidase [Anaerohalosphaeraceae bacterium]|nr:Do family serine endopeptidase [Anaerohalosphaeraceae bacterium]HPP55523.1 Do family serine endopeptidase [Anaerohalosphaeraceae bacterium]
MFRNIRSRAVLTVLAGVWMLSVPARAVSEETAALKQTSKAFTEAVKKVLPAVVAVQSEYTVQGISYRSPFEDDFFERFFGPRFRMPMPREEKRVGQGSGFLISEDGYILTNHHVVADASKITILLHDGRRFENVEIVGSDEKADLALLKIPDVKGLPTVKMGNSDLLEVGEWVIAVGNPFGLTETVTVGVVSAKGRRIRGDDPGVYEDFIQTDAAINPGNSGGPLLNIDGEVVGINAAIVTGDTGVRGYMGIGLAVPINMAKSMAEQMMKTGKFVRGYAGIGLQDLTEDIAQGLDLKIRKGAIITQVYENSPAEEAGLQADDIIISIDNREIHNSQDVRNVVGYSAPGTKLTFVVLRNGSEKKITLTVGARPVAEDMIEQLGIQVKNSDDGVGVVITDVKEDSDAARVGLQSGMVILSVNRERVNSVKEFKEALRKAEGKDKVILSVKADRMTYYVVLPLKK